MSALPRLVSSSPAQSWFTRNLPEIQSRSRACLSRVRPDQRDDALAEVMGVVYKTSVNAQKRGVLAKITPFHAVDFAVRQYRQGRRMGGYSSTDVTSEATQRLGRSRVVSLSDLLPRDRETGHPMAISEVLADRRRNNSPYEQARQNMDYPGILRQERVSRKARKVFKLLTQVRGQGAGLVMAHTLRLSPGRICQLKDQLATALAKHGYGPSAVASTDSHPPAPLRGRHGAASTR